MACIADFIFPVNSTWLSLELICERFFFILQGGEYNSILLHFGKFRQYVFSKLRCQGFRRFCNQISCKKGLKAKISRFFTCFFCLTHLGTGMFQEQKDRFVPDATQAEEIRKSASTELHEWSKNMVNLENCIFLKEHCEFLSLI